jgi:excisionase family DNA binding protein
MSEALLTTAEAAERLKCRQRLVRKLIRAGELRASNIAPGGKRPTFRIDISDLTAFIVRTADGQSGKGKGRKRTRDAGEVIAFV